MFLLMWSDTTVKQLVNVISKLLPGGFLGGFLKQLEIVSVLCDLESKIVNLSCWPK